MIACIWNSLATCGPFGTMVNHAMSCFSPIKNYYCCKLYSKTSIKPFSMCVLVCSIACIPTCMQAYVCVHVCKHSSEQKKVKGTRKNNVPTCRANVPAKATSMRALARDESLLAYSSVYSVSGELSCACGRLKL